MTINGSCHCGAVAYEFRDKPEWATDCNCSTCRRLSALWIYSDIANITIKAEPGATVRYMHGPKTIAFHTCNTCGSTAYWENLEDGINGKMAVNLRLANPEVVNAIKVRKFDGADTWAFVE